MSSRLYTPQEIKILSTDPIQNPSSGYLMLYGKDNELVTKDPSGNINSFDKFNIELVDSSTTLLRINGKIVKQKTNQNIWTTLWPNASTGDNLVIANRSGYTSYINASNIEDSSTFTLYNNESINLAFIDSKWLIY